MAMMLVDGVELPTPSSFEWGMIDVSASDSGRTQDGKMHKNRIAQKRQLKLSWNGTDKARTAKILQMVNPEYIRVMVDVNVIGSLESKFESTNRIYDVGGCSPTLSTMQGGNQEPKILEAKQLGFMDNGTGKHQSNTVYDENALCPNITTVEGGGTQQIKVCESQIVAMRGRNPDNPSDRTAGSLTEQRLEVNMQGLSNCLTSVQKDNLLLENNIQKVGQISSNGSQCGTVISDNGISANLVAGTHGYVNSHIATQYRIRKLTPRECGRLMGVSDEDIDKMAAVNSNTQLYKQFGNSIVVDVMCAMFKNLNIKQGDSNEALQTN